ncbi:MAG: DUF4860 domain-containing protein [Oscillospiraceae bacterium]|nr:DUF4860 domain-containing protein [Oscillospiraceae bacterium]
MKKFGRSIDTVFVLIVFSVFAISVLMVLMLGASIYRNINEISTERQNEHTALAYIWTKTRNFDQADGMSVGDFNGVSALLIDENINGTHFRTIIYNYDGWLLELFSDASLEFSLNDGVPVVPADGLHFDAIEHGLIQVTIGDMSLYLSPRSGAGCPNNES